MRIMEAIKIVTEDATWVLCHLEHNYCAPPGPILCRLLYGEPSDALQTTHAFGTRETCQSGVRLAPSPVFKDLASKTGPTVIGPALRPHEGKATGRRCACACKYVIGMHALLTKCVCFCVCMCVIFWNETAISQPTPTNQIQTS